MGIKDKPNKVTTVLKVVVTGEFYDDEAMEETLRCAVEQDLEDAGFDVDVTRLKEQEAVEPIAIKQEMFDEFYGAVACCPKCGCMWLMNRENNMHYCPECGQAVKWE